MLVKYSLGCSGQVGKGGLVKDAALRWWNPVPPVRRWPAGGALARQPDQRGRDGTASFVYATRFFEGNVNLPDQSGIFPTKTRKAPRSCAPARQQLYASEARVLPSPSARRHPAGRHLVAVTEIMAEAWPRPRHLSCIGQSKASIRERLAAYAAAGQAHRGAARRPAQRLWTRRRFRYASDLVAFIRAETGRQFHIEVAAYPETHLQAIADGRPGGLCRQGAGRGGLRHHALLLQQRRYFPLSWTTC